MRKNSGLTTESLPVSSISATPDATLCMSARNCSSFRRTASNDFLISSSAFLRSVMSRRNATPCVRSSFVVAAPMMIGMRLPSLRYEFLLVKRIQPGLFKLLQGVLIERPVFGRSHLWPFQPSRFKSSRL